MNLRKLLEEATPRPWSLLDRGAAHDFDEAIIVCEPEDMTARTGPRVSRADEYPDAALIVAAVNNLDALLDVVEQGRIVVKYGRLTHEFIAALAALDTRLEEKPDGR